MCAFREKSKTESWPSGLWQPPEKWSDLYRFRGFESRTLFEKPAPAIAVERASLLTHRMYFEHEKGGRPEAALPVV